MTKKFKNLRLIINEKKRTYHTFRSSFLLAGLFLFKRFKLGFCFIIIFLISVFLKSDLHFDKTVYFKRKQLTLLNSTKLETVRRTKCSGQLYHIFFAELLPRSKLEKRLFSTV